MPSPSITTILPIGIFIAIPVLLFILWVVYQKIQKQKAVQREQKKLAPGPNPQKKTLSTLASSRLHSIQSDSPPTPDSLATTNPVSPALFTTPTSQDNPSSLLKTGHYLTAKRSEGGVILLEDDLDPSKSENSTLTTSMRAPESSFTKENRKSLNVINEEEAIETDCTVKPREKRINGYIQSPDKSEKANNKSEKANNNQQLQTAEQYLRVSRHEKGKGVIVSTNTDGPEQTDVQEPLPTHPAPMSPPIVNPQVGKSTPRTSKEGDHQENLNNVIIHQLKVPPPSAAIHTRKSHRSSTDSGVFSPRNTDIGAQHVGVDNPVFVFPDKEEERGYVNVGATARKDLETEL